ncbi:Geranial dehydrogenase [Frankia canadensis]|uniref:aldehyde dehydrogenase (NAD(+)) n=1 Tax=Frankia canadensis TaxID=1836972 RepID=A0A2I2KT84_9ACTN|nr:aldehyde dehydrogenase [Frankia canadensis]SNQ48884.1 Geranial dehydrogenase [Frankia canadensis]SOU56174.1 Geranial dehydrogenase [Frankia canadensis]
MIDLSTAYERDTLFIGNEHVPSVGHERIDVVSPSTEEKIGSAAVAQEADIDRAVAAARQAFDDGPWPRMSRDERRAVVRRAGELLRPLADELTQLVSRENGVTVRYRQGHVAPFFDYHTDEVAWPRDELRRLPSGEGALVRHEPVGVVGAIVPWNAPVSLGLSKVLPALVAGCTVVLKPSPETPLHDHVIAEAFAEAGLPAGALNVVPAHREVSEYLVRHRGTDMISFTGSTAAGRRIGAICGEQIKRVTLELGGKSAAIVLDDMDAAAMAALVLHSGMLLNNGEACMAWTRILVPRARYDELLDAFCAALAAVKVGDPLDPTTDIGPLVAERQRDRVESYVSNAVADGAKVVFGGGRPKHLERGWFVEPTLLVDVDNSMTICREEVFGPVGTVMPYTDEEEAIRIANDSNYGLAGGVFTADPQRGLEVAGKIRAGTIGVNSLGVDIRVPFGGYKDSGVGRAHGPEGFAEYFEVKTVGLPAGFQPS